MNIFEALRQSHDVQRHLGAQLLNTKGASAERDEIFQHYKLELQAHETAEERYFYIPLYGHSPSVFPTTPHRISALRRPHLRTSLPSNSQNGQGFEKSSITSDSKSSRGQI